MSSEKRIPNGKGFTVIASRFSLACIACVVAVSAHATTTINKINVSTVFGYLEYYSPGPVNRFGLLGAPLTYELSNGELRSPGAGWIPYTNGTVTRQTVSPSGTIEYEFGSITNWAAGGGALFYHLGQVWNGATNDMWTEGKLVPASPLVLVAQVGSTSATMTGLARIDFNNSSNAWGSAASFVPYTAAEGSVVPFSVTYTLLNGATWQLNVFDSPFEYSMSGQISLVPEPATFALLLLGLVFLIRKAAPALYLPPDRS
jgi:hypothetical protein